MPWIRSHLYLVFWLPLPVAFVMGIYRLLSKEIIVKGDLTRFLLYLVTFAALGVMVTPDIDEAIKYSTRFILIAGVAAIAYERWKRK